VAARDRAQRERAGRRHQAAGSELVAGLGRLHDGGYGVGGVSRPRRRFPTVAAVITILLAGAGGLMVAASRTALDITGIADGQHFTSRDVASLQLRVESSGVAAGDVTVEVNDTPIAVSSEDGAVVATAESMRAAIGEGTNTLTVELDGRFVVGSRRIERTFTFELTGPRLIVADQVLAPPAGGAAVVRGLVDAAEALTANGAPVEIEPGGAFTVQVPPDTTDLELVAVDAEGHSTSATVQLTMEPAPATYPRTAAVHVTASDWADPAIREQILSLARSGRINAVQLDIKDEGGAIGYDSGVELATEIGSAQGHYDARAALDQLHSLGLRVIGRIVCFLDPVLGSWAWDNERDELVVLSHWGSPLTNEYGTAAFTNFANPEVRQYQIDLAVEAANLGFDEILYDYVRRPEGNLDEMDLAGLLAAPDVVIARFVADTEQALAENDTMLGVSVFGISATRPQQIAQDIRLLAPLVDYVAPMVYPSHWGAGEYGVADPVRQPGDIVTASLTDFHRVVAGSGAAVVPWLQDFSTGQVPYGRTEVAAQIDAALATGSPGFLLWNPSSTYTVDALPTNHG
jgi:hypothetical protein